MDVFGQGVETKLSKLCNSVEIILIGGGFRKGTTREKDVYKDNRRLCYRKKSKEKIALSCSGQVWNSIGRSFQRGCRSLFYILALAGNIC